MSAHPLSPIVDRHLCMGCGACAAACPDQMRMVDTVAHGRRPMALPGARFDEKDAALLTSICPGAAITPAVRGSGASYQDIAWGPVLEVWEAHAADPELRWRGSSGGVVSALSVFALESGATAGSVHVRARADYPLRNEAIIATDRDEVRSAIASRYAPASPCERLAEVADSDAPHLFVGKPCDVAAARALADRKPTLNANLALTISIFCAGTPSLAGSQELARALGAGPRDEILEMRYRGEGWPGEMMVRWRDAASGDLRSASTSYASGWGEVLTRHKQWRCQLCADHLGEHADLAIGDPWYRDIEPGAPGSSLIVVRNSRGQTAVAKAMAAGVIVAERRDVSVLARSQPNLERTRGAAFGRCLTGRMLGAGAPRYRGAGLLRIWWRALTLREKLASMLGTARRIFLQRRHRAEAGVRLGESGQ